MEVQLVAVEVSYFSEKETWQVLGYDASGREYLHEKDNMSFEQAMRLKEKIKSSGKKINYIHWHSRAPYGTQAWLDEEGVVDTFQEHCDYEANARYDYLREAYGSF